MVLADNDARYVDANPAACALFGLARDQLVGRPISDFAAPGHPHAVGWRHFLAAGRLRGTFPLLRPDGETRLLEGTSVANIVPGLHLCVLRELSERAARSSRRKAFGAIVESSGDAIFSVALDGTITS